ncbi:hypothetical protein QJQ45_030003 [Haematococcus lacustris]|nr:hypothetical protein QJQ45_030003 [Haematococcus lacustris]
MPVCFYCVLGLVTPPSLFRYASQALQVYAALLHCDLLGSVALGLRDPVTGQVLRQWEWELSKGQLKHDSGLTKAKQDTARWSTAIQPQLLQLAAATPAGTTLGGLHAHVLALKATWDALWEEYLKPRWRRQRLALHHAQERIIEGFCKKRAASARVGGAKAVREGFRKVVEQPSRPSTDARPDRLVIVDEFRTSRVSSSVHARQPCELHLPDDRPRPEGWIPPAGQVNQRLVRPVGPAVVPSAHWGEHALELCSWKDREALPPVGKEYQQGYKRVNDRLPKICPIVRRGPRTSSPLLPAMRTLLPARACACSPRPGLCTSWRSRPAGLLRGPAPRTCLVPWLTSMPLRALKAPVQALRHYEVRPQPNLDLEQLVSAVEELPYLSCNSQVEQASQLLWSFADWAGQSVNSRARMTQVQRNAVMNLLQHLAGGAGDGKAGSTPAPLAYFDAHQMNMAAASLGKLRPHLHPDAVTSACAAVAHHGASIGQAITMILWAMAKSGYTGSAQPLLQAVTTANSQGEVMADAKPQDWATLIWATSKLPGCREEARHLLDRFAARSQAVVPGLSARNVVAALEKREVSDILFSMGLVLWHDKEVCRQLAERAAETMQVGNFPHVATSLYNLARLGYLDSSVRSLAAGVARAYLTAFPSQAITKLLAARSMFLALSVHQAVSSGHSQLVSEPQLNSMAAALWRECSRREAAGELWSEGSLLQLNAASQCLHACTGGRISLDASPALQKLVAKAVATERISIRRLHSANKRSDCQQLLQALARAGHSRVQQAALSQDGTCCTQLLLQGPGLTLGIAVSQSPSFLHDGSMSGVMAHAKLQQVTHFDAGVVVNKAVFDQLASDSERAAFMREQVLASLPEAEAWRQLLQAGGGHWAGQGWPPAAATPAAQQQQAVSVAAGQQAKQQGASPSKLPRPRVIAILLGAGVAACADCRADPKQSAPVWATLEPSLMRHRSPGAIKKFRVRRERQCSQNPAQEPWQPLGLASDNYVLLSDMDELVSDVEVFYKNMSQVKEELADEDRQDNIKYYTKSWAQEASELLWKLARQTQKEDLKAGLTKKQRSTVLALVQFLAKGPGAGEAGSPPALPRLQELKAVHLSKIAWSLGKLRPHLPPATVTSACIALAQHAARDAKAMRKGGLQEWGNLLHGLATAGMQCSSSPDLTSLCDKAVQLDPWPAWRLCDDSVKPGHNLCLTLAALVKTGYMGNAQPLLQEAECRMGLVMSKAKPWAWFRLIQSASQLPGCRAQTRQLLSHFATWALERVPGWDAAEVSDILSIMNRMLWSRMELCKVLAELAGRTQPTMSRQQLASSLYSFACLGYLDSSVRDLAAKVAEADLTAFKPQELANLLYARSMFLALSIHQAVSSGHSQLASEPELNSMAAALWRECSRRGPDHAQWRAKHLSQMHTASQWLHVCTGGQTSLAASPALQELVSRAGSVQRSVTAALQSDLQGDDVTRLVQALAAAGLDQVQQAVLSQDGSCCAVLLVTGQGLTRGIEVDQSCTFLHDGSMSGVVAHAKLQQVTHFDAGVMVNKAVFDQLASDSERAAFMHEQVRASLPEAEAWRQLLQADGGHCAVQVEAPAAATPAAQQQQSVSVLAGQQARQQGALPLPAAQAKSAGALPSQRAGQVPGLMPHPVRPQV